MSVGVFTFDILVTFALSAALLFHYGNWRRHRIMVTVSVLIAWYFSFIIIFVLPLDVSNTSYKNCLDSVKTIGNGSLSANDTTDSISLSIMPKCQAPSKMVPDSVLFNLWRVVYWSSQFLTWLVLPLMQSFTQAGEFTFSGKLKSAVWDNSIFYASYLFIAIILLIYIALQPNLHLNFDRIKAIAAGASNTWGLFVLVLMLGYGLVEVPRNLWRTSHRGYKLDRAYFKIAKLMVERSDAEEASDDTLNTLCAVDEAVSLESPSRKFVDIILTKVPIELLEKMRRRRGRGRGDDFGNSIIADEATSERGLTRLHRKVITSLQTLHRTEAQWTDLTHQIFHLEDVNRNMISNEHFFKHSTPRRHTLWTRFIFTPVVEWYWRCLVSPLLLRCGSIVATVMSAMIIWSEVTFFSIKHPLSLFAVFVSLAQADYNYWAIELICFFTLCYLSFCTYYTIFKIRVLNYFYLAKKHQSDEFSLLFSGALLCRLTPPLCLNFLSIIHMDSHVIQSPILETSYTRVMGHMDVISIVSDYFNIYFPIILLALTSATYFSLGARCLSAIGFQQFLDQESELTQEMVEEGKEHVKREKRRIQRLMESSTKKKIYSDRFGSSSNVSDQQGNEGLSRSKWTETTAESSLSVRRNDPTSSPERSLLHLDSSPPSHSQDHGSHDFDDEALERNPRPSKFEPPRNLFEDW